MFDSDSKMLSETLEAPRRCGTQLRENRHLVRDLAKRLRGLDCRFAATMARGSSAQAATFLKVLLETGPQIPTLAQSLSIGSLYGSTSRFFRDVPVFMISQSGRSPDLLRAAEDAKRQQAFLIALVNDTGSPLADLADIVVPIHAGPEKSVAATKSFITTLTALAHINAEWSGDDRLMEQLFAVEEALEAACRINWQAAVPPLGEARSMFVLGRGLTLPIAGEAALKLKETSALHAEAFSIAEVAHGPMTLIGKGDPVLIFGPADAAQSGVRERIDDFADRGATVIAAGREKDIADAAIRLPVVGHAAPAIDAITMIQSFYGLANAVSLARGMNPDNPPHLQKVTRTL